MNTAPKAGIDYAKLTPAFLKKLFSVEVDLIEKHQRAAELIYEMMAGMAHHAPLVRPAKVYTFALRGIAIVQPSHWLVYHASEKNRVRAYADGTLTEPSAPPRPVGFMIPTGRMKPNYRDETADPTFLCLYGKTLLGEWGPARCVTELTARQ